MGQIKIITGETGIEEALRRQLKFNPLLIGDRDLILVDVNVLLNDSQSRADKAGLDVAMKYAADPKNVVILLGLEPTSYLRKVSPDFVGLMARENVDFADIIGLEDVMTKYHNIVSGNKKEDSTGRAIYDFQKKQKSIAILKHGISLVDHSDSQRLKWLTQARDAGINGTDDEVIDYVRTWVPETAWEFPGKSLKGLFVDAYQTLFDDDWQPAESVIMRVRELAKVGQFKVFVISDSEERELTPRLANAGIDWPLLSKFDLRGVTLELVVDNLTKEKFEETYRITATTFVNVSEL